MSGLGRGRARSRLPEGVTPGIPLRRPANLNDNDVSITLKLKNLKINSNSEPDDISEVVELIKKSSDSGEQLRKNVTELHEFALTSKSSAALAARISGKLSYLEVQDLKFRNLLLEKVQKDFAAKDVLQEASVQQFHSAIVFLCEIFQFVKLQNGTPIQVLATPVLNYMDMLLKNASDEDLDVFCDQFTKIGKLASSFNNNLFKEILLQCRRTIISAKLTSSYRSRLLKIFELSLTDFKPLSSDVSQLYKEFVVNP